MARKDKEGTKATKKRREERERNAELAAGTGDTGEGHGKRERRRDKKSSKRKKIRIRDGEESDFTEGSDEGSEDEEEEGGARRGKRKRSRKESEERRNRKRDKSKKNKKGKRGGKDKRDRRKRRRNRDSSDYSDLDSSSESSDASLLDKFVSPTAVASRILEKFPDVATDLEQLLQLVDNGQAVDISGLPNKALAASLKDLFHSLSLRQAQNGMYLLPKEAHKKTLDIIGPIFRCQPNMLGSKPHKFDHDEGFKGPELIVETDKLEACFEPRTRAETEAEPSMNPVLCGPDEPRRRVIGPAMPTAEMLAAAARLTEAGSALREAEEELEQDPMIGPPPPIAVAEAESTNEAERFEEISRILAPDIGNAYEVLGLKLNASSEVIKKRYWKLSLMVHPDKCNHPQAHQAFTALNQAFKDLQDPTKRAAIDLKVEEKEAREEYEAELKAQREAAHWRRIRGEAVPGDDILLSEGHKPPRRDEWMTELPPERQAGPPSMHSTYFSKSEKSGRGDTSVWTDNPLEKAQKAKMQYLQAFEQATLAAARDDDTSVERERMSQVGQMMDKFNKTKRQESLVEKHQADLTKKVKREKQPQKQEDKWVGKHPWQPWDREKDLTAGRQSLKWDAGNMAQGLASRFSSSDHERSFL